MILFYFYMISICAIFDNRVRIAPADIHVKVKNGPLTKFYTKREGR